MKFYNNLVYTKINFYLHQLKPELAYRIYDPEKGEAAQYISRLPLSLPFIFSK